MRVSILAYDGCLGFEIFGLADVLLIANRISNLKRPDRAVPFSVDVVGATGNTGVRLAGGTYLAVKAPSVRVGLLVVPAFDLANAAAIDSTLARLTAEIELIARAGVQNPVAGICGGSFLLAEAGLLNGRRAATAWVFEDQLALRYPSVKVESEAMLVRDGPITTTGAFSASIDLALQLVSDCAGPELARDVGRIGLLDNSRSTQGPYVDAGLLRRAGHQSFAQRVTAWLETRLAEPYSLKRLAGAFHVSDRTLLRRFKAEAGRTPLDQLQNLRIGHAKRLLETTTASLAEIAEQVGYRDLSTFSKLFVRKVSLTPAAYRRRFRPAR